MKKLAVFTILFLFSASTIFAGVKIKDVAGFEGVRENQLIGYGLVVGLNGTGDKSQSMFTVKSISSLLKRMGIDVPSNKISPKNVAAVMVTATLPPFVKPGAKIDVTLSSLGDAGSLLGGTLLLTPLQGADGIIYAVAQGNILMSGGPGGGYATVARIPEGALIEREIPVTMVKDGKVKLSLKHVDFTTCIKMAEAVNVEFGENIAKAVDGATVEIKIPQLYADNIVPFLSRIENINIVPHRKAKIVINEKTGTIVSGVDAKIARVSIVHKNLNIDIKPPQESGNKDENNNEDILPKNLSLKRAIFVEGETSEKEECSEYVTAGEVASILASMGVKPNDMIAIFQAIKEAGAIEADMEIM